MESDSLIISKILVWELREIASQDPARQASPDSQGVTATITQAGVILLILVLEKLSLLRVDAIPLLRVEFGTVAKHM